MSTCVACDKPCSSGLEFCRRCYGLYKQDILAKKSWVRVLKNESQKERRRKEKDYDNTSLDSLIDWQNRKRN